MSKLTQKQAVSIVLSWVLPTTEMGKCQEIAPKVISQLAKLGYKLSKV